MIGGGGFLIQYDLTPLGTSINPARSLGPALDSSTTANHWVFWVGPLLGGALGGVLYRFGMMNNQVGYIQLLDGE